MEQGIATCNLRLGFSTPLSPAALACSVASQPSRGHRENDAPVAVGLQATLEASADERSLVVTTTLSATEMTSACARRVFCVAPSPTACLVRCGHGDKRARPQRERNGGGVVTRQATGKVGWRGAGGGCGCGCGRAVWCGWRRPDTAVAWRAGRTDGRGGAVLCAAGPNQQTRLHMHLVR